MSRLVLVSNRVGAGKGAAGGLAVALGEAVRDRQGLWLGWSGKVGDEESSNLTSEDWRRYSLRQMDLSRAEYEDFYLGYSNRCLWPLVHFRADLMEYQASFYRGYRRVNARFAAALMPLLAPDDVIWVHDFHLLPLAAELRALGAQQRIGFFLHTPFPPRDIFSALPAHAELARAMFDYDLAGFQTLADQARFAEYMCGEHAARHAGETLTAFNRQLEIGTFPVGIDAKAFQKFSYSAAGERQYQRMRDMLRERQQIIGVDRLDYSKGLRRRVTALELMFGKYPQLQRQVEFLQISPVSRGELKAYRDFRRELEQAATSINSRYAQVDWTPMRYLNRTLPRQALAGIYRASRVGLVTPMRDGMNLVAKEYTAAQDAADPGVLVLSRFAGAAQQLDRALLINPYDPDDMADAIQKALTMSIGERRERHEALIEGLLRDTPRDWAGSFLRRLAQVRPEFARAA